MEFLLCARMRSRRFLDTLTDKRSTIGVARFQSCWNDMKLKRMIGLKAGFESLLKEAEWTMGLNPGVNAWAREMRTSKHLG
jgi:hypothetical protein